MTSPAERPYGERGKYQGQRGPTPSKFHEDFIKQAGEIGEASGHAGPLIEGRVIVGEGEPQLESTASADVVQWQNASFPSSRRGFDSPHPLGSVFVFPLAPVLGALLALPITIATVPAFAAIVGIGLVVLAFVPARLVVIVIVIVIVFGLSPRGKHPGRWSWLSGGRLPARRGRCDRSNRRGGLLPDGRLRLLSLSFTGLLGSIWIRRRLIHLRAQRTYGSDDHWTSRNGHH
jgi:hypothetical protein